MGIRKMAIQEGLNELKVLDSRIKKALNEQGSYVSVTIGEKSVRGYENNEKFAAKAKGNFDSINALLNRKTVIKNAIIKKNAEVVVEIGGKSMTLAEAINNKTFIEDKRVLLNQLMYQYNNAIRELERAEIAYQDKLDKHIEMTFGKDQKDKMKGTEDVFEFFNKNNKPSFIDPIKLKDVIDELSNDIDTFEAQVDFVLTRANIINDIEFEDPTIEDPKDGTKLPDTFQ